MLSKLFYVPEVVTISSEIPVTSTLQQVHKVERTLLQHFTIYD